MRAHSCNQAIKEQEILPSSPFKQKVSAMSPYH